MSSILIFCDGACSGNPGPGGWGAIVTFINSESGEDEVLEMGGASPLTTNNKMELTAAIEALKAVKDKKAAITICTDSTYVIKGITQWLTGWRGKGWKTSSGTAVANQELWEELHGLTSQRTKESRVEWRYVPGHKGVAGNERADEIAVLACSGKIMNLYRGTLRDYKIPIQDFSTTSATAPKNTPSKKAGTSYLSFVDGIAQRHLTWAECEKRVRGVSGAKYKKAGSKNEEIEILGSWGLRPQDLK